MPKMPETGEKGLFFQGGNQPFRRKKGVQGYGFQETKMQKRGPKWQSVEPLGGAAKCPRLEALGPGNKELLSLTPPPPRANPSLCHALRCLNYVPPGSNWVPTKQNLQAPTGWRPATFPQPTSGAGLLRGTSQGPRLRSRRAGVQRCTCDHRGAGEG